ncbi:MAG TPA: hypothetical protein VFB55_11565, partial [Verrucomicrobiae bacterium]|nr:hypothetical protein [Verrucomicrobiae bacterium]
EWNGGSMIITNRTGVTTNPASSWVCVAGRYGVVAGPDGIFCYRAAAGYNRAGAAQDYLSFLPSTPLGARYCVWFPGKNAAQTAALAGQISWRTNGSTVVLSFPGNGGGRGDKKSGRRSMHRSVGTGLPGIAQCAKPDTANDQSPTSKLRKSHFPVRIIGDHWFEIPRACSESAVRRQAI